MILLAHKAQLFPYGVTVLSDLIPIDKTQRVVTEDKDTS